jgi:hypothetical protein
VPCGRDHLIKLVVGAAVRKNPGSVLASSTCSSTTVSSRIFFPWSRYSVILSDERTGILDSRCNCTDAPGGPVRRELLSRDCRGSQIRALIVSRAVSSTRLRVYDMAVDRADACRAVTPPSSWIRDAGGQPAAGEAQPAQLPQPRRLRGRPRRLLLPQRP